MGGDFWNDQREQETKNCTHYQQGNRIIAALSQGSSNEANDEHEDHPPDGTNNITSHTIFLLSLCILAELTIKFNVKKCDFAIIKRTIKMVQYKFLCK